MDRFWKTGRYEKKPVHNAEAEGGLEADGVKAHVEGCKETLSLAMDTLSSSRVVSGLHLRRSWKMDVELSKATV